jgi:ubiquinone/menaquinone biosynthesis C-methylase UbiE
LDTEVKSPSPMVFDKISRFWSEMANAHETQKQVNFVEKHFATDSLILDLASGNGRHSTRLCQAGYEIVGLDISKSLLRIAAFKAVERNADMSFINADMRFLPFRDRIFEGVLSLDTSIGYLPSDVEDLLVFAEVKRILNLGGKILIDVFNGNRTIKRYGTMKTSFRKFQFRVLRLFPFLCRFVKGHDYPSFRLFQIRRVDAKREVLSDSWLFCPRMDKKMTLVNHSVRLYTLSKLQNLLDKANLHIFSTYGGYEGEKYEKESSRLIVVGINDQKPKTYG